MKSRKWMFAIALGIFMVTGNLATGQGHGNGHGKGHEKHGHGDDDDLDEGYYKDRDREAMRGWYDTHQSNLPPGLAKRDQLPPRIGNATRASRHAPAGTPETPTTLSRRP